MKTASSSGKNPDGIEGWGGGKYPRLMRPHARRDEAKHSEKISVEREKAVGEKRYFLFFIFFLTQKRLPKYHGSKIKIWKSQIKSDYII